MSPNPYAGATGQTDSARDRPSFSSSLRRRRWVILAVLLVAVGVGSVVAATAPSHGSGSAVRATPGDTLTLKGVNMEPTLEPGDVIAATVDFQPAGLTRGEIVVFNEPSGEPTPAVTDVVDRLVGLPGGKLGPLPDMYERVWFTEKLVVAAEAPLRLSVVVERRLSPAAVAG
jgi:Signal peptidase, peptidase S26